MFFYWYEFSFLVIYLKYIMWYGIVHVRVSASLALNFITKKRAKVFEFFFCRFAILPLKHVLNVAISAGVVVTKFCTTLKLIYISITTAISQRKKAVRRKNNEQKKKKKTTTNHNKNSYQKNL